MSVGASTVAVLAFQQDSHGPERRYAPWITYRTAVLATWRGFTDVVNPGMIRCGSCVQRDKSVERRRSRQMLGNTVRDGRRDGVGKCRPDYIHDDRTYYLEE
jgi:hypothetical protein